jgi:alkylated DNA repair protein alkB family protein 8
MRRICAENGVQPLTRSAGAHALFILHGGLECGVSFEAIDAALRDGLRPVLATISLWHSDCGLWAYAICATADEACAAYDHLHESVLSALPRHALVCAFLDERAVEALLGHKRATSHAHVDPARVPGLRLLDEYLDEPAHAALVATVEASDRWECRSEGGRRVQHFGLRFDYATVRADTEGERPPWPEWCAALSARLFADGLMPAPPNQVTVNSYEPGEGISWHCDTHSAFGPAICSLSLLADTVMRFRAAAGANETTESAVRLPARSLLVLAGESRYGFEHSIATRFTDLSEDGLPRTRARRVSITFRTVDEGAVVPCTCRWPALCDSQLSRVPETGNAG